MAIIYQKRQTVVIFGLIRQMHMKIIFEHFALTYFKITFNVMQTKKNEKVLWRYHFH